MMKNFSKWCWKGTLFLTVLLVSLPVFAESLEIKLPKNVCFRGSFDNSRWTFETTGRGRVAFLGGSITEMDGYRPMVCDYLRQKFPRTSFEFIAGGISSTCSDVGAFRLDNDILSHGAVDLFFVEFAVNDDQDGMFSVGHAIRGMEGIIRNIRTACPNVDIVMTFFVNEHLMDEYRNGDVAASIQAHQTVAERYAVSTINLAREIQEQIDSGQLTWDEFGGVHPVPRGNRICADMIAALLDAAWSHSLIGAPVPHVLPEPLDRFSYSKAGFRGFDGIRTNTGEISDSVNPSGFRLYVPDWPNIPGAFRQTFAGMPLLCAEKPGAEIIFDFEGTAVGFYLLAGPDSGIIEYQIDDGSRQRVDTYHPFSTGLHYPRAVVLADELEYGSHHVMARIADQKNERSSGTAVRILQICINR